MEKTVGPYQLGDSLGTLPFGELVTATHSARSEPLAVLLLDDRLAKDHRFRGLLRLEIARAGGLRHPAICRTVEVGEHSGALYVVVERPADAQTLARVLADGDQPTPDETLAIIRSLAEGLDAMHGRRLVHGALNPSTVLIGPGGNAALVGIVLLGAVEEAGLDDVVAERTDPACVAPEQQAGRRTVASADGYALGVLAAALLRVQPAPAGPADGAVSVLTRQTSADPAARFPTCVAFASALAEAIAPTASTDAALAPSPRTSPAVQPVIPSSGQSTRPPEPVPVVSLTADTVSLPPPTPAPEPSLPWDAPAPLGQASATAPTNASGETVSMNLPPPEVDAPTTQHASQSPARPAAPGAPESQSAVSGGWLQSIIDPSRSAQPSGPPGLAGPTPIHPDSPTSGLYDGNRYTGGPAPAASDTDVTVTTIELTPAMADLLKPEPPRDLIADAIRLAADRVPAIDEALERYAPDGKVGPVQLGVAVAAALAVLLILAGQVWPATVLIMVVVVLYAVPRLGSALTASERANPRAVRVTGTVQLKRRPNAFGAGAPELVLPNGVTLSLRFPEFESLTPFGRPVTVQQPAYGTAGVTDVVVWHDLPAVTVTYITPNQLLLDVRSGDGAVLFRRPPYRGEADDRLSADQDSPPSEQPDVRETAGDIRPHGGAAHGPGGTSSPTPHQPAPRQSTVLPMPPAAQAALHAAAKTEAWKAGAILVGALVALVVLPQIIGAFGFFVFIAVLGLVIKGSPVILRALSLWHARHVTTMKRVVGPVIVSEHRSGKSHHYYIQLADGTRIKTDSDTHRALAFAGEVRIAEAEVFEFDWSRNSSDGYLQSQHEIPAATTTYAPGATLLLEIVDPVGDTIYRDPILKQGDLGPVGPPD